MNTKPSELVAGAADGEFVQLQGGGNGRFGFRIASASPREHWPEDIELRTRPALYIAFHSATRSQRERFVSKVESLLAAMGHKYGLEED